MKLRVFSVLALAAAGHYAFVQAQSKGQEHWVATWTTAQLLARTPAPAQSMAQPAPTGPPTPQSVNARGFDHQTVRMMIRTSISGRRAPAARSTTFGRPPQGVSTAPLTVRA